MKQKQDIHIPETLNECFIALKNLLPDEDLNKIIKSENKDIMHTLHHTLGRWIRNNWGLWKGKNKLVKIFYDMKITHPDDMSGIILTSFWYHIHNEPFDIKKQVIKYQEHWKKYGFPKDNGV